MSMPGARVEVLERIPLFAGLRRRQLRQIAGAMSERTFPAGETIATEGEPGVGFFVIDEGRAKVTLRGADVRELGPGDWFGEMALIVETPRTATVAAETDLRCFGMTSWQFRSLAEENAAIAWTLLEAIARRLHEAEQRA